MFNYFLLYMSIFIIILCIICYYYRLIPEVIPSSNFPDIQQLTQNKTIFINDLLAYSEAQKWINYHVWEVAKSYNSIQYDVSYINLDINKPAWRGFIIRLNKVLVPENIYTVPQTTKLILNIPNAINVVMTCLEAGFNNKIKARTNPLGYTYRAFVPIYISEKEYKPRPTLIKNWNTPNYVLGNIKGWDTVVKNNPNDLSIDNIVGVNIAGNSINLINMEKNNDIVIFDSRLDYQIWNRTKYDSFILVVDVLQ